MAFVLQKQVRGSNKAKAVKMAALRPSMEVESNSEEKEGSIDDYLPALPSQIAAPKKQSHSKKMFYKKIVRVNKKTGEVISEEKQLLKGGVFGRLSL